MFGSLYPKTKWREAPGRGLSFVTAGAAPGWMVASRQNTFIGSQTQDDTPSILSAAAFCKESEARSAK